MKKKTLGWIFFILLLITSLYGLNKSKSEINLGIMACIGGQGGSSNLNIQTGVK